MKKVVIENAYEIRDIIKMLGGTFRSSDKVWIVSQEAYKGLIERNRATYGMKYVRGFAKINAYSEVAA